MRTDFYTKTVLTLIALGLWALVATSVWQPVRALDFTPKQVRIVNDRDHPVPVDISAIAGIQAQNQGMAIGTAWPLRLGSDFAIPVKVAP